MLLKMISQPSLVRFYAFHMCVLQQMAPQPSLTTSDPVSTLFTTPMHWKLVLLIYLMKRVVVTRSMDRLTVTAASK